MIDRWIDRSSTHTAVESELVFAMPYTFIVVIRVSCSVAARSYTSIVMIDFDDDSFIHLPILV